MSTDVETTLYPELMSKYVYNRQMQDSFLPSTNGIKGA